MENQRKISIEVAFCSGTKQQILKLDLPVHSTARQAVQFSKIAEHFPEFNFSKATIGVFGKTVPDDYLLSNNDRVEVYRPLNQSPTEARRKREKASHKRKTKRLN